MRAAQAPTASMQRLIEQLWYSRDERFATKVALFPLWLLSLLFGFVVRIRRALLAPRGVRLPVQVISVGNLTVGGAGKTPVTIHLANGLLAKGERVAVLSRGYGGRAIGALVVSDGTRVLAEPAESGDEPYLIARACPGAQVIVCRDRVRAGRLALERFSSTVLLLDDGFQHLRLARDRDVLVLDASNPFGNGHLMPRGPLREPRSAMRHAHEVWLSKADQVDPAALEALSAEVVRRTGRAPLRSFYRPTGIADASLATIGGPEALAGKPVLLCAGIARPESFRRTVASLGARVVEQRLFPDHHNFTREELAAVDAAREEAGAELIVMTEKDAVRLAPELRLPSIRVVKVEVEVVGGDLPAV